MALTAVTAGEHADSSPSGARTASRAATRFTAEDNASLRGEAPLRLAVSERSRGTGPLGWSGSAVRGRLDKRVRCTQRRLSVIGAEKMLAVVTARLEPNELAQPPPQCRVDTLQQLRCCGMLMAGVALAGRSDADRITGGYA